MPKPNYKLLKVKKLLIFLLCSAFFSCVSTKAKRKFNKITIDKNLSSPLFNSTEYMLNPLTLKTDTGYDNVPDSTKYIIKSNAIVNKDSLRIMRSAQLKQIHSDTIELRLFETNPLYSQNLTIKMVGNHFKSNFTYSISGPPINPKIKTLAQHLRLKSLPKQKGKIIYGSIYFRGICESDCTGEIQIKGDFKAELE